MTGRLRIIGGRWRGRRLDIPDRPGLRPTGDRARETLFNWLQGFTRRARCLDLFAGSGALGLEAASRGAAGVVLVERDHVLYRALKNTLADWPESAGIEVVRADALRWLPTASGSFDLVFVDPPFDAGLYEPTLAALARPGLLAPGALVYVESPARAPAPLDEDPAGGWEVRREKALGEVRMQLLRLPG